MLPYLIASFICFILTVKRALVACVLRATTKKRVVNFFEEKKCIRVTWVDDFLTSKRSGSFTALVLPLVIRFISNWHWAFISVFNSSIIIVCRILPVDARCVWELRPSSSAAAQAEICYGNKRRADGCWSKQDATK